jgi:hypothetical protein
MATLAINPKFQIPNPKQIQSTKFKSSISVASAFLLIAHPASFLPAHPELVEGCSPDFFTPVIGFGTLDLRSVLRLDKAYLLTYTK